MFEIDDEAKKYRRFPNREAPRERPEWSDHRAGMLQDFIWHPFDRWTVDDVELRIYHGGRYLRAPLHANLA